MAYSDRFQPLSHERIESKLLPKLRFLILLALCYIAIYQVQLQNFTEIKDLNLLKEYTKNQDFNGGFCPLKATSFS